MNKIINRIISFTLITIMTISIFNTINLTVEAASGTDAWKNVKGTEWMKHVDGKKQISEINMPGTHDSGTQHVTWIDTAIAKCQDKSIKDQLNMGVRFLDIRLKNESGKMRLVHGSVDCLVESGIGKDEHLTFKHVLNDWVYPFLQKNPTETIVMSVYEQGSSTDNNDKTFSKQLLSNYIHKDKIYWYDENKTPTLDEVRGKIVLLRRYQKPSQSEGLDFSDWSSSELSTISTGGGKNNVHIQDNYKNSKLTREQKWGNIKSLFEKCESNKYSVDDYILNFSSMSLTPEYNADYLNPRVKDYSYKADVKYGWIVTDFMYDSLARALFSINDYLGPKFEIPSMNEDSEYYYINFETDRDSGNAGRIVVIDLFKNTPEIKFTFKLKLQSDGKKQTFIIPKSGLYPKFYNTQDQPFYDIKLYEVGDLYSYTPINVPCYSYIEPGDEYFFADINSPSWALYEDTKIPLDYSYTHIFKYDDLDSKLEYTSTADGIGTKKNIDLEETDNTVYVDTFDSLNYKFDIKLLYLNNTITQSPMFPSKGDLTLNRLKKPTNVSASAVSESGIQKEWNISWNHDGPYEQYKVELAKNDGSDKQTQYISKTDPKKATFVGLDFDTDYICTVGAMGGGLINSADKISFKTGPVPKVTLSPNFTYIKDENAVWEGTVDLGSVDPNDIEEYEFFVGEYDDNTPTSKGPTDSGIIKIDESELSHKLNKMYCKLKYDNDKYLTTNMIYAYKNPETPKQFNSPSQELTSIDLSWNASEGAKSYRIEYTESDSTDSAIKTINLPSDATNTTINELKEGTKYNFKIYAVGFSVGDKEAISKDASISQSTLARAKSPTDVAIDMNPAHIQDYGAPITYSAMASSPDNGTLTYQWFKSDDKGIFSEIVGETNKTYTIVPTASDIGLKVLCVVTNNLNGTSAFASIPTENILFRPSQVDNLSAAPDSTNSAMQINATWENPDLFDYYIITCEASDGSGEKIIRLIKATGIKGDTMGYSFTSLNPDTKYTIKVENVMKNPLENGFILGDLGTIASTSAMTTIGVESPVIISDPVDQKGKEGQSATLVSKASAPVTGTSIYTWTEYSPDLQSSVVLDTGILTGTKELPLPVKITKTKEGYHYALGVTSTNNGDVKIATSSPASLIVVPDDSPDGGDNNDENEKDNKKNSDNQNDSKSKNNDSYGNGSHTADSFNITLWVVLGALLLMLLSVVLAVKRNQQR